MLICDGCRALAWAALNAELSGTSATRWSAIKLLIRNELEEPPGTRVVPTVAEVRSRLRTLRDGLPANAPSIVKAAIQILVHEYVERQDEDFPIPEMRT